MGRPTGRCWHLTAGPWAAANRSELSSFICSDREICYCHAQARQAEFRGTRLPRWGTQRERVKQSSLSVGTLGPVTSPAAVTHFSFPVSINHEAVVLLSSRSLLVQTAVSSTSHTQTHTHRWSLSSSSLSSLWTHLLHHAASRTDNRFIVLDYWNGFNAILSNAFFWVWLETPLALFDCLPLLCSNRAPWLLIGWKHLSQCCEIRDDTWYIDTDMGGWYWWFLIYFPVDQYSVVVN